MKLSTNPQPPSELTTRALIPQKAAFLVSDEDWQLVLRVIPIATFLNENGEVVKYPLLVYHAEPTGVDADAIFRFLKDFKPDAIYVVGPTPNNLKAALNSEFSGTKIELVSSIDLARFWKSFKTVVYSASDLNSALHAAYYAAALNAPLMFEPSDLMIPLTDKKFICVNTLGGNCAEKPKPEDIQRYALKKMEPSGVVLTSSATFVTRNSSLETERFGTVSSLFGKTALLAPYQALVRKNVLVTVNSQNATNVKQSLSNQLLTLAFRPNYLTLVANPFEIQMTTFLRKDDSGNSVWGAIDATQYGNLDNDSYGLADARTGRLMGFTTSDVSSIIARTQFYDQLPKGHQSFFGYDIAPERPEDATLFKRFLETAPLPALIADFSQPMSPELLKDKRIAIDQLHGSPWGLMQVSSELIPDLTNTFIIEGSCSTCSFDHLLEGAGESELKSIYCLREIRKGAVGLNTSVDSNGQMFPSTRLSLLSYQDAGESARVAQNFLQAYTFWYEEISAQRTPAPPRTDINILLSDPYFKLDFQPLNLKPQVQLSGVSQGAYRFQVRLPYYTTRSNNFNALFVSGISDEGAVNLSPLGDMVMLELGPLPTGPTYSASSSTARPYPGLLETGAKVYGSQIRADGHYVIVRINLDFSKGVSDQKQELQFEVTLTPQ